jgi:mRNA-degrading endonuclease RelE of RelBE toxin-antitoxin system
VKHYASRRFWKLYDELPDDVRNLVDKKYKLLKADPHHRSLHLKRIGALWSMRVGSHYRALGHGVSKGIQWFWIGTHADYDKLVD